MQQQQQQQQQKQQRQQQQHQQKSLSRGVGMICFSVDQRHFTCFRSAIEGSRVFLDFAAMKPDPVHRYEVWAFKKTRY